MKIEDYSLLKVGKTQQNVDILIKSCLVLMIVMYMASIFIFYYRGTPYSRPLAFYMISSINLFLLVILTSVSIHSILPKDVKIFLFLFLSLLVFTFILSQYYMFPSVTGVDPWFHMSFNDEIFQKGRIPYSQPQYFGMYASSRVQYSRMPAFHLLIVSIRHIIEVDYKTAAILSVSLPQLLIVPIGLFLLSRCFIGWSFTLSSLVVIAVASSEHFLFMLRSIIPNSLGGIYLVLFLWSLFKFLDKHNTTKLSLLILIFSFMLIITHSISTIAMYISLIIVIIFLIVTDRILYNSKTTTISRSIFILITAGVITYLWWTYVSGHTPKILDILKVSLTATKLIRGYAVMKAKIHFFDLVIGIIPVILYHFLALIGVGMLLVRYDLKWMISNKVLMLTILIGGTYAILGSIPRLLGFELLTSRWWYFSEIFLSVPVAMAVEILITNRIKLIKFAGIILILIYFSLTLTEPQYVSIDSMSYYEKNNFRYSLTLSEMKYMNFSRLYNLSCVSSDEYYSYILNILGVKTTSISAELLERNFTNIKCPVIIIRNYITSHPTKVHQFLYKIPYNPLMIVSSMSKWDKVYSSNTLQVFRKVNA